MDVRVVEDRFITIDFGLQPLFDESGSVISLVPSATDITDRVRAEDELKNYRDHLEEVVAERTAELGVALDKAQESDQLKLRLLSTVSHELRAPLAAIKGFSTTLLDYWDKLDKMESIELLKEIDSASDRLGGLIDNLLQLSQIEAGMLSVESVPTRVSEVIETAVAHLRNRDRDKRVTVDIPQDLPLVLADPRRLIEVLDNLLENSLKYTMANSQIWVEGAELLEDGKPVVRLTVRDDGPGISPKDLTRIFEPFHQLDERTGRRVVGIGLGLAICRRLIEGQDGRIWAEGVLGEGASFNLTLPVAEVGRTEDGAE